MDPTAEPLVRLRQGAEASVRFMAAHAQSFALLEVENLDREFADVLRRGTEVHADDSERLVRAGIAAGPIRDEDPRLLAVRRGRHGRLLRPLPPHRPPRHRRRRRSPPSSAGTSSAPSPPTEEIAKQALLAPARAR